MTDDNDSQVCDFKCDKPCINYVGEYMRIHVGYDWGVG